MPKISMGLEPFDPKKHQPQDMGRGGPSTEITITNDSPDGRAWNIPSLWFSPEGRGFEVDADRAQQLAIEHEEKTGKRFPRFKTVGDAVKAARKRSAKGGATKSMLSE